MGTAGAGRRIRAGRVDAVQSLRPSSTYPTRQQFDLHRTSGCHDRWVNEYTIRYDDQTVLVFGIMEFRDARLPRSRWTRVKRAKRALRTG